MPLFQRLLCLSVAGLAACSGPPPLSLTDKARFTRELIAERPECAVYAKKLGDDVPDRAFVERTYEEAKAAHCLKPDV